MHTLQLRDAPGATKAHLKRLTSAQLVPPTVIAQYELQFPKVSWHRGKVQQVARRMRVPNNVTEL